jgi:hypothetical protein
MDAFSQAVNGWHDFYLMIGTAAATLVGLLFVSLSLNADAITRRTNADLRALAEQTFSSYIFVLLFAVFFLIPHQDTLGLGLPLLGVGGIGFYSTVRHFLRTRHTQPRVWRQGSIGIRFIIPTICFVVLITIAISVLLGKTSGLYWLVPVMILLMVIASFNAWDLLIRLRELHEKS